MPEGSFKSAGETGRVTDHEISPVFRDRWSPRAFSSEEIPEAVLLACFEAARWAPSGFNLQPWRFVYAKRNGPGWEEFLGFLSNTNRQWASGAAALVLVTSHTVAIWDGKPVPSLSHAFDAGAAWSNFAHQASLLGWHTHAMGGFDRDRARTALDVPPEFGINAVVAIGRLGDPDSLPEALRARERPSARRPLSELVMEGRFRR